MGVLARMVPGQTLTGDILGASLTKEAPVEKPECIKACCPTEEECSEAGLCLESCREGDERCEGCPFRAYE